MVLIFFAWFYKQDNEESKTWPRSEGVIIENSINTELSPKNRICYIPVVQYIYQANHRMVQGSKIHLSPISYYLRQKKAQQWLEHYPVGRKVWVFYNPHNPQEAVLERNIYDRQHCILLGMIFIIFMMILLGLIGIWWINENQAVADQLLIKSHWLG